MGQKSWFNTDLTFIYITVEYCHYMKYSGGLRLGI